MKLLTTNQAVYSLPVFENSREGVLQVMFTGANGSALVLYDTSDGGRSWRVKRVVPLSGDVSADTLIVSSVIDAETVITALPQDKSLMVIDGGVQRRSLGLQNNLPAEMVITQLDFKNSDVGWLLVSGGRCAGFKTDCAQETKLLATANGGQTLTDVTPQVVSSQKSETSELNAIIISGQRGFDKCTVASAGKRYTTDSTGRAAAKAFVDGWVTRLNERGNDAGVYGSPGNALDDWQGAGVRPPRAVWIAKWDGRVTVFGLSPLPDSLWRCHQRIHQYRGGHNETFGGVTFNIDNNVADGPVEDR